MKSSLFLLLALTLSACGQKDNSPAATASAAQPQGATPASSDPLSQVTSAEAQLQSVGCYVQARDVTSRRGPGQARIDCDRVPARMDDLRNAENGLRSYSDDIRAALADSSISDSDREQLNEKNAAANAALEQIRQRMQALDRRPPGAT